MLCGMLGLILSKALKVQKDSKAEAAQAMIGKLR
jgi:hypothetical protein